MVSDIGQNSKIGKFGMDSDGEIKKCLSSALRDLDYINPDTLHQLKGNMEEADLHFPLLDLYVSFQDEVQRAKEGRRPGFSVLVGANQTNARKIESTIKKYLQARLDQSSFGVWGKVGSSCDSKLTVIKDILISIEQLCSISLDGDYDRRSLIQGLLESLNTKLEELEDEKLKSTLFLEVLQIKKALAEENFPELLSFIKGIRTTLRSLEGDD